MPEPFKSRFHSEVRVYDFLPGEPSAFVGVGVGTGSEWLRFEDRYPNKSIVCFEPDPAAHAALLAGTHAWAPRAKKPFPGVLLPYAVWDETTTLKLHRNRNMSKVADAGYEVEAVTLRQMATWYDNLGDDWLLWLDCEGSELRALQGCDLGRVMIVNVELRTQKQAREHGIACWDEQVLGHLEQHGLRLACEYRSMKSDRHWDAICVRT